MTYENQKAQRDDLTEREAVILEQVIGDYIATAAPVGSRHLSRSGDSGLSAATIRNTMSDLEEKGFLWQPHPSAGRVPTDKAYRFFVDTLARRHKVLPKGLERMLQPLSGDPALERVVQRAAQALSVLTCELGVGIAPLVDEGVLENVDLIRVGAERLMLILTIQHGLVKTIFVEIDSRVSDQRLSGLSGRLRERLAGLPLGEIRRTARERLKDAVEDDADPLNVFVQSADSIFELGEGGGELVLGGAAKLASQPEFSDQVNLRSLIGLTERRDLLLETMKKRAGAEGLRITIGAENELSELSNFTLITDTYRIGRMKGIIGVIGPTRMSYSRVISVVEYTSRLLSKVLES
ncbi:heat-inducible transcriptional repressor HrcA [bacterium]|nr:heat-inducible transcriptional repressor HrcA [bacterium]